LRVLNEQSLIGLKEMLHMDDKLSMIELEGHQCCLPFRVDDQGILSAICNIKANVMEVSHINTEWFTDKRLNKIYFELLGKIRDELKQNIYLKDQSRNHTIPMFYRPVFK
jgi:hypothetical protein